MRKRPFSQPLDACERSILGNLDTLAELRDAKRQRDGLLAAMKQIMAVKFSNWSDGEMREIARAAIVATQAAQQPGGEG